MTRKFDGPLDDYEPFQPFDSGPPEGDTDVSGCSSASMERRELQGQATTRRIYCDDPSAKCSEKARELIGQGWQIIDGRESHEISRALGCAWAVATLEMQKGEDRRSFRFVGKPDDRLFLYSNPAATPVQPEPETQTQPTDERDWSFDPPYRVDAVAGNAGAARGIQAQKLDDYGYPIDWPKCPSCGLPAMDGHVTCRSAECDEGGQRERNRIQNEIDAEFEAWAAQQQLQEETDDT